ncbi:hypothetical protein [Bosea sp. 685]|uniref:hypothetical protein n=1 Tax=Bosea sp. 685 TaxID=3080057 RepID=UPI00289340B8|nr:hypothetical protein [Bosea sp. 685]WNJ91112.1 hypothetical protein RMR04_02050 [Bosea sp. 685]
MYVPTIFKWLVLALCAGALTGCQTTQESLADAEVTCESQGFRLGTRAYQQCHSANYVENRRASNEAASAVAAGVAAGVIGGVIAGAAVRPYDRRGYYAPGGWDGSADAMGNRPPPPPIKPTRLLSQ